MILEKVIADSGVKAVEGSVNIDITSVCNDSRKAAQGSLFVAVKGFGGANDGIVGQLQVHTFFGVRGGEDGAVKEIFPVGEI